MRVVLENYGDCVVYVERPFKYRRYIVEWSNQTTQLFSGLWYKEQQVRDFVEKELNLLSSSG